MTPFTHTSRITRGAYIKFLYRHLYTKPTILLIYACSIFFLTRILNGTASVTSFEFYYIIFSILFPTVIVLITINKSGVDKYIYAPLQYTFTEEHITIKGADFQTQLSWKEIFRLKETRKLLFFKTTHANGTLFDKTLLTPAELQFIRSKISSMR